jgi:hypothetical protein
VPKKSSPPATTSHTYYVRNPEGKIGGPYTSTQLKTFAHDGKLLPMWEVSRDRTHWIPAAKVQGLFDHLEKAIADQALTGHEYRALTKSEVAGMFLDKFVFSSERFQNSFPWFQKVRVWWAKLTMPRDFVLAEVTASGVTHVRYDVTTGSATDVEAGELDKRVANGVRQLNWFAPLACLVAIAWVIWTINGLDWAKLSLTLPLLKAVFLGAISFGVWVAKIRRTRVYVGYSLDEAVQKRLELIREAFRGLRRSCKVWAYTLHDNEGELDWKYNAGSYFKVARLPVAVFDRPIPNVETNVRVCGVAVGRVAIYFLPEKALVIDGGRVIHVPYAEFVLGTEFLEYPEIEGCIYRDSKVVGERWKKINRDQSQDLRFKENVKVPLVQCGVLRMEAGGAVVQLLTSSPTVPAEFKDQLEVGLAGK